MTAIIFGGGIDVIKLNMSDRIPLQNFSQLYAIPKEKSERFERSIIKFTKNQPFIKLSMLKTWSLSLANNYKNFK